MDIEKTTVITDNTDKDGSFIAEVIDSNGNKSIRKINSITHLLNKYGKQYESKGGS